MNKFISKILVGILVILSANANAQWTTNSALNTAISNATAAQLLADIIPDGSGGAIICWTDERNGETDIYAQRINALGVVQWTTDGVPVIKAIGYQTRPKLVSDGLGGAIFSWSDNRSQLARGDDIYAQRLNGSGVMQWDQYGVAICLASESQGGITIISDNNGGAIITWDDNRNGTMMGSNDVFRDIYAQRINSSGVVQWSTNGVVVCEDSQRDQKSPVTISDNSGGAIITWEDLRTGTIDVYAQRINASGVAQWTTNGVVICSATDTQLHPKIETDSVHGAIITWADNRSGQTVMYVQRINEAGVVQWTKDGVALSSTLLYDDEPQIVSDGSGGAIITWGVYKGSPILNDIYAQAINKTGQVKWKTNGIIICNATDNQRYPRIASDKSGGAIIIWKDGRKGAYQEDIFAQRINEFGTVQWAIDGIAITTAANNQHSGTIVTDELGGAIIAWADQRIPANPQADDVFAQNISPEGLLGVTTPVTPGIISGSTAICSGSSNIYSIKPVYGTTSYNWTFPNGWSGNSTNNSINLTCDSLSGIISVSATNAAGTSSPSSLTITVNSTIPDLPTAISGLTTICSGTINSYSITAVGNATSYNWSLPSGWSGSSTTNSINLTPDTISGTIKLTPINGCGASADTSLFIKVNMTPETPGLIGGLTKICTGTNNTYKILPFAGVIAYNWTLPNGWTGTSTADSINIVSSAISGSVTVTATNAFCTSAVSSLPVIVYASVPATPQTISGKTSICSNTSNTYTVSTSTDVVSYNWTIPGTWTGTVTTNGIYSKADTNSGTIFVIGTNACGDSDTSSLFVTVNSTVPPPPGTISGSTLICPATSNTYTITPVSKATSYIWTKPSGWTGTSTTNTFSVTPNTSSGNITVNAANGCGTSSASSLFISINSIPPTPGTISGASALCLGTSSTYSISPVAKATSYNWVVPNGWNGSSTTNAITTVADTLSGLISVKAGNECGFSSAKYLSVTVDTIAPGAPGAISGQTTVCSGSYISYTITAVSKATSYTWTKPTSWTGNSATNTLWTTANTNNGDITVAASNGCGTSLASSLPVILKFKPITPATISGTVTICSGTSNAYSVPSIVDATSYTWTLPSGWVGNSTTDSIYTTSNENSGTIGVTATNTCGTSTASSLPVTVHSTPATPGAISGIATICSGTINTYSVSAIVGATSYDWSLPNGWTGTSTTNTITITADATGGVITVTAKNDCFASTASSLAITINNVFPSAPEAISGPTTICSGISNIYNISPVTDATSYKWTLPNGWTGTSTTNTITVTSNTVSGTIKVAATNSCGSSVDSSLAIIVVNKPDAPISISGLTTICSGTSNIYNITPVAGASSYNWTLPGGWIGTSVTNSMNATANATSGTITVTSSNSCGNSSPFSFPVFVNTAPTTPGTIKGIISIKAGAISSYSVAPVAGAISYNWVLPIGWSGSSSTNVIDVTSDHTSGNITVSATNACGISATADLPITSVTDQEWVWINGDSLYNPKGLYAFTPSNYGTKGVAASSNKPGGRSYSVSWKDPEGDLWLFGGIFYAASTTTNWGIGNDLWKYNINSDQWTWVSGDSSVNEYGNYGSKGIGSINNKPGARWSSVSWSDSLGNLWLFGGNGYAQSKYGLLNDLWKFNTKTLEWTWVSGTNLIDQASNYGSNSVEQSGNPPNTSATNMPGGRHSSTSWIDNKGNLWLFGGLIKDTKTGSNVGATNEFWKYDPIINQWTWVKGSIFINQDSKYLTGDPYTCPSSRTSGVAWADNSDNLWLFGGQAWTPNNSMTRVNDLWKYNITTNLWSIVKSAGGNNGAPISIYGTQGVAADPNNPAGKSSSSVWTDLLGNFWLYGGILESSTPNDESYNDLWKYNPKTNQWTWVQGIKGNIETCNYGKKRIPSVNNSPGTRTECVSWVDNNGNFWLFGGWNSGTRKNDLWKFNNCQAISAPVDKTPYITRCSSDSIVLIGGGNGDLSWYDQMVGGTNLGSGKTFSLPRGKSGNFTYYLQDSTCSNFTRIAISVNISPSPTFTISTTSDTVCKGAAVILSGAGTATYNWSDGINDGVSFIPTTTKTYSITGTDTNGCSSNATITITVIAIDAKTTLNNSRISANYTTANAYQWMDCNNNTMITGATDKTYSPSISGNYAVELSANGCLDTSACTSVTINCYAHYTTVYDPNQNEFILTVDSTTSTMTASYLWDFGDGTTSTLATPTHTFVVDTVSNVCMKITSTSGDSCSYCHFIGKDNSGNIISLGGFTINIINPNALTGTNLTVSGDETYYVFPNPTSSEIYILFSQSINNGSIQILNIIGQTLEVRNNLMGSKFRFEINNQISGMYFIEVTQNGVVTRKKLLKQ